jgi:hypothetical protein
LAFSWHRSAIFFSSAIVASAGTIFMTRCPVFCLFGIFTTVISGTQPAVGGTQAPHAVSFTVGALPKRS